MNEIREVARAYYDGAKEDEKQLARQFFQSLDANADGKVSLQEYKKLVDPFFSNGEIFRQLDENGDGTLEFDEVLALYYMDKVSIPRCSACHDMLLSSYFSCLLCQGKTSYYLCCNCYGRGKFKHQHPSSEFADTRALLKLLEQLMGKANITTNQRDIPEEVQNDSADGNTETEQSSSFPAQAAAETIAATVDALDRGLNLADTVVQVGTVAASSGCSIM